MTGVCCSLCPEKRPGHLADDMQITQHDVMFVLLCSLIRRAAVQNMAGLMEGDAHVTEVQIYIGHPSDSKSIPE